MRSTRIVIVVLTALLTLCPRIVWADVTLPAIFSDNMVLQRGKSARVWGKAAPGEQVGVKLFDRSASAAADAAGRWQVALDLTDAPAEAGELVVSGDKTATPHTIKNVMVGEVWLASGQSNMEKPLGLNAGQHPVDHWEQEVAASANPQIRVFTVARKTSSQPLEDCQGKWEVASPQTTAHFTAAGYFFAREINRELHTPVGIIHSSWGGTRAEAWTSREGFAADPELAALAKEELDFHNQYPAALKRYHEELAHWMKANHCEDPGNRGEKEGWAAATTATEEWQPANMGSGKKGSIAPGIRWYRKTLPIPPEWKGHAAYLLLGTINGLETVYFNSTRVGGLDVNSADRAGGPRQYLIPGNLMQPGTATIAVRIVSYVPTDSPISQAYRMAIACVGTRTLGGPWVTKTEATFPPPDATALKSVPTVPSGLPDFDTATLLFNGMIHPLIPYSIAGVIWYQGESNALIAPWVTLAHGTNHWYAGDRADPPALYERLFPLLIRDWRTQWEHAGGRGDFPFYYCQIANFKDKTDKPGQPSVWAEVREAQRRTLAAVPNVGMAVLIDIGLAKDIHPTNKQEVGRRLALQALAQTYGWPIEYSGPLYQGTTIEGDRIRVRFTHAEGLMAQPLPATFQPVSYNPATLPLKKPRPDSPLQGFEICGADGRFVWADAVVDGQTVVVSSPAVHNPVAVRYAWADNPTCNLSNAAGLPASPFTTKRLC